MIQLFRFRLQFLKRIGASVVSIDLSQRSHCFRQLLLTFNFTILTLTYLSMRSVPSMKQAGEYRWLLCRSYIINGCLLTAVATLFQLCSIFLYIVNMHDMLTGAVLTIVVSMDRFFSSSLAPAPIHTKRE